MSKESKGYSAYAYDQLEEGRELKINHTIYKEDVDISGFLGISISNLEDLRKASADKEQGIFQRLCKAVEEWEDQAVKTQIINRALYYAQTPTVKHTSNQWQEDECGIYTQISNMVYSMDYRIREDTKYDRETEHQVPVAWYVSWNVYVNGQGRKGYRRTITGQENKRYTDKAAAEKYLQGRIKAYTLLFTEISPPIPKEYAELFKVNGQLLPGYTIEGQEPQHSHAATELSEGGVANSTGKELQKPSVLGQLSASKVENTAVSHANGFKKERGSEL